MKTLICILALSSSLLVAETPKTAVKIVNRQYSDTAYSAVIPGHSSSTSNSNVDCSVGSSTANCYGSSHTNGWSTSPREVSYSVTGSTLSLQLPDGKVAVVNCVSKYRPRGDYINRRSCRVPLTDDIQAEFHSDNAKLFWSVSLDGKKIQSETYKILAVQ